MTPEEIAAYAEHLHRRNSEALGFIPRSRIEDYAEKGQVWLTTENDEPCGYIVFGIGGRMLRVYQACIQYDARRRQHGLDLVQRLVSKATSDGFDGVTLRCRDGLEANEFWRSVGFRFMGQVKGGARRGKRLNVWTLWLESRQGWLWRP